jgi:hypothetical protein
MGAILPAWYGFVKCQIEGRSMLGQWMDFSVGINRTNILQGRLARLRRSCSIKVWGMDPITGADQFKVQLRSVARMSPSRDAGNFALHFFGMKSIVAITTRPRVNVRRSGVNPLLKYPNNFYAAVSTAGVLMPRKLSI